MFTKGRLLFVIFFILVFIIGMIYAYKKDLKEIRYQYTNVYRVFLSLLIFLLILYLLVKFWHRI